MVRATAGQKYICQAGVCTATIPEQLDSAGMYFKSKGGHSDVRIHCKPRRRLTGRTLRALEGRSTRRWRSARVRTV